LTNVLFVCIGNTGRSLLAEQVFRADADGRHEARSAGAAPGRAPEPSVVEALAELGIDASGHVPQKLTDDLIAWADVLVAACDGVCPVVPGKPYFNWQLPDPYGEPLDKVRALRDDVRGRVDALIATL
jgi:arsenate reductase